ncbi:MAG TPA: hypothetical protein VMQ62_12430 [Dongiaceae bacterium]|nr:hypothetical protein [Dongiaceae bacterium]
MSAPSGRRGDRLLAAGAAALVLGMGAMSFLVNGRLVYALDDPYIHMSVARSLAQHGVWGLRADAFASASSSPLWTLLLAGVYRVAGPSDLAPLLLNALAAGIAVLAAAALLDACGVRGGARPVALLAVILLAPLGPIGLTGMEHVMHAAATLAFVAVAVRALDRGAGPGSASAGAGTGRLVAAACLLALVMTGLRFEGLFMAAGAVLLFLLQRRVAAAAAVAVAAWVPVVIYGWYSTAHGAMWLPNPVAIKGNLGHLGSPGAAAAALLGKWFTRNLLVRGAGVLLLVALAILALLRRPAAARRRPAPRDHAAAIFVVGALLHLQLASLGWFFRYEMYLVALGVVVVAAQYEELLRSFRAGARLVRHDAAAAGLLALAAAALLARAGVAHARAPRATREIAMQQVQMARFLERYYDGRMVAVNDIGAVSWYSHAQILDLWGLANLETARLLMRDALDGPAIARLAAERSVRVALVYDEVLGRPDARGKVAPPPGWTRVGVWKLARNVVAANWQVSIYDVAPDEEAALREHLREFAPTLPPEVTFVETPPRTADAALAPTGD